MHVANLESRTLAGKSARTQRRDAPLVGHLGQRIVLIHELGKLARAEEFLDNGRYRLCVDQLLGHESLGFGEAQALLDGAFDTHQPDTELVLRHFTDAADTAVAQVIDVIDHAVAVLDIDENLEHVHDVFLGQYPWTLDIAAPNAPVELHATDRRQIVAIGAEKQIVEQRLCSILGGRLARAHHAVNLHLRLDLVVSRVCAHGRRDIRPAIHVVHVQRLDRGNSGLAELGDDFLGENVVGVGQHFTAFLVHHISGKDALVNVLIARIQLLDSSLSQQVDMARSDAAAILDNQLAFLVLDVESGKLPTQAFRDYLETHTRLGDRETVLFEEGFEDLLGTQSQSTQQYRSRQLAAPVNTHVDQVLRVELTIEPRTAIGNDPSGEQQLA